jgi:HrpA-like RNA helicase
LKILFCNIVRLIAEFTNSDMMKNRTALSSSHSSLDLSNASEAETEGPPTRGSVLVFLPGLAEISRFYDILYDQTDQDKYLVITLHSSITLTQDKVRSIFKAPPKGKRKVNFMIRWTLNG